MSNLSDLILVIGGNPSTQVGATGGIDMNSQVLPNLGTPVAATDGATKLYVDNTAFSGDLLLDAKSILNQPGGALAGDTIFPIEFGIAQAPGHARLTLSAAGVITYLQVGTYTERLRFSVGRDGSGTPGGEAHVFLREVLNGAVQEEFAAYSLSETDNFSTFTPTFPREISSTPFTVVYQLWRDSGGAIDGGLFSVNSTLTGNTSPSAKVCIYLDKITA